MASTQTAGGRSSTSKGTWREYENVRAWLLQAYKTRKGISDTIAELQRGAARLAEGDGQHAGLGWEHPTVLSYLDNETGVIFWEGKRNEQDREIAGALKRAAKAGIILPSTAQHQHQQRQREQAARLRRNARRASAMEKGA